MLGGSIFTILERNEQAMIFYSTTVGQDLLIPWYFNSKANLIYGMICSTINHIHKGVFSILEL